jgi:hypothetical protein
VVNPGRKEVIQVDGFSADGNGEEGKRRIDRCRIQNAVDDGHDQKDDGALGHGHDRQK